MDKFWENYIKTRPANSKGAFDAFRKMSQGPRTMANGGRIGFTDGLSVQTLDPLFPTKDPTSDDFQPLDVPGAILPPLVIGTAAKRLKDTFFKDKDDEVSEDLGDQITTKVEKDAGGTEPPEDPWDPNKLLEILESTTYNIAENRVKNKAMNYLEKKINERALELSQDKKLDGGNKRRDKLNSEFKELLGNQVSITAVNKKDGKVTYQLAKPGKQHEVSKNLIETINKREDFKFKTEQPFRSKGFVTSKEFLKHLEKSGFVDETKTETKRGIEKNIGQFAKFNDLETIKDGKSTWIQLPSVEKTESLVKKYLPMDKKIKIAKDLIEEHDLKSFNQINAALLKEGYPRLGSKDLNKYFPNIRQQHYSDKDFVYSGSPQAVLQDIRRTMIRDYGSPTMEKFLVSAKHKLGFGKEVDLIHPQQKEKPSGAPYKFADLMFGSAEENKEYNQGLDRMRSSLTNALKVIKYDYEGKDLNQKIKVPFHLQEKFDFPKEMPIKKYIQRLNYMLTDLSTLTGGKVSGELLHVWGNKMKFVENRVGIDWSLVPGKGLLEGALKKHEKLFKKFKNETKLVDGERKPTGRLVIGEDGYPVIKTDKEGKPKFKLTEKEKGVLFDIVEGLATQLTSTTGSKPVSLETFKEIIKPLAKKAKGGPVELDFSLPEGFAGGGRAGLSGSSTSGRPPESGPQSGGLPSLYNNVRKW